MQAMRQESRPTRYPGVYQVGPQSYRIRATIKDERTGKRREVDRLLEGVSAPEAAREREQMRQGDGLEAARVTLRAYAQLWIASKAESVDRATAKRYAEALDLHVLPELGDMYMDAMRPADVQAWINSKARIKTEKGAHKYAVATIRGWFRVLRTMARDAVAQLDLPRDPTGRVTFPDRPGLEETNALSPDELASLLSTFRTYYRQHLAMVSTLALTGQRFCHVSALRWEDVDFDAGNIKIARKAYRGNVGPVSKKKRAPKAVPMPPELADVLKDHRVRMIEEQHEGLASGWVFPSETGKPRLATALDKPWSAVLDLAGVNGRFTIHGLRRTFTDHLRLTGIDPVVRRALTGHVTEKMQDHYSSVSMGERMAAVSSVVRLVGKVGTEVGTRKNELAEETKSV